MVCLFVISNVSVIGNCREKKHQKESIIIGEKKVLSIWNFQMDQIDYLTENQCSYPFLVLLRTKTFKFDGI